MLLKYTKKKTRARYGEAVAKAIGKMRNRVAAGAFERWVEMWQEAKDLRAKCLAIVKKMMNRALQSGFQAWVDFYERRRWEKMMIRKAIGKMQNGLIAKAWETWAFNVEAGGYVHFHLVHWSIALVHCIGPLVH